MYAGAGIALILIIATIVSFTFKLLVSKQAATRGVPRRDRDASRHRNLDYQPGARPISPLRKPALPPATRQDGISPLQKTMSVVDGRTDITDSVRALVEKYSLDGFTLATNDGLVFAACGSTDTTGDAATFGGITITPGSKRSEGVALFTIPCKETHLTGIIRSDRRVPASILKMIEDDTQDILNRWI